MVEHSSNYMFLERDSVSTISYSNTGLEFDVDKVIIETYADTQYQGSFNFQVSTGQKISGYIFSTAMRMQTTDKKFFGKNLNVPFLFDGTGMEPGDSLTGEFHLVTDIGEFQLPYQVRIIEKVLEGDLGEIRNLFHFANLSRVNWKQAKECFISPLFPKILIGSGSQYGEQYKMLLQYGYESGNMDLAMDRFLIVIHKKQAVTYSCPKNEYVFTKDDLPDKVEIQIERTGWGYTYAKILSSISLCETDAVLTEKDFSQDRATFFVSIDKDRLHIGENRIDLSVEGSDLPLCEIIVTVENTSVNINTTKWNQNILKAGIVRLYLDYRTGRRPIKESFKEAEKLLLRFRGMDELLPALYEAHLKLLRNKDNEAIWLLKNAKRMAKEQEATLTVYGYFLYLLAMSGDDARQKASDLLEEYMANNEDEFFLYWGCMHKEHLQYANPPAVYRRLRMFFEEGCTSPILYLEAAMLILENELLLPAITDFEIQVLLFMERYRLLSNPVCEQMYKLPFSVKKLCPLFVDLCKNHPAKDDIEMAKMMSRLYMKLDYTGTDAAQWLKKGIVAECRINGLYEAYIRSLNLSQKENLPTEVVRYFAYDTPLEDRYLAYVYEKVLKQQEKIGSEYLNRIHDFTKKQLLKGKINNSLSYLYRNALSVEDMDEESQLMLQKLVFANELIIDDTMEYRSCVVRQKGLKDQKRYSLKKNKAVIYLYTNEYTIMFETAKGAIVDVQEGYQIHPFMDYEKTKGMLAGCNNLSIGEQLYLYKKHPLSEVNKMEEFDRMYKKYLWLLQQEPLEKDFKKELSRELLHALQKWDMHKDSRNVLLKMRIEDFATKDKAEFISGLANMGYYEEAYKLIVSHGMEGLKFRTLMSVCQYMLQQNDVEAYNEKLLKLSYYVFCANKYTTEILEYLNLHFIGTYKQMKDIYRAMLTMELSPSKIAQSLLENMIYTEMHWTDSVDIFRYCYSHEIKEDLIDIYLSRHGDSYLVFDNVVEDDLWEILIQRVKSGACTSLGMKLAILKYYSGQIEKLDEETTSMCMEFLGECLKENLYLTFFDAYRFLYPVLDIYNEWIYVEYRDKKHQKILIRYVEADSQLEEKKYCTEEMKEVYPGIYQKAFRIFWGENVPYYIIRLVDEEEQFMENGDLEMVSFNKKFQKSRYHWVNEIVMLQDLGDYEQADTLVEQYELQKHLVNNMLHIK